MVLGIITVFILGYTAIAFEHQLKVNKAAIALITGVLCWTILIMFTADKEGVVEAMAHHLGELSQILFFLLGAMTVVELIDVHDGFEIITRRITTTKKRRLMWVIALLTFFLSAVLDNLTTTIVMLSLVRKLISSKNNRLMFAGLIVIAANAGGAWSPIGDVTTTMLWISGRITSMNIILELFLPSFVCLLIPLLVLQYYMKGNVVRPEDKYESEVETPNYLHRRIVFVSGIGILLFVPVFKTLTHLPPFMGILLGLSVLWVVVERLNKREDGRERKQYTVAYALRKIDTPSILFFLGILLAIAALETAGQLTYLAQFLDNTLKDENLIVLSIGLLSSIVDNVPLVAASTGMYSLQQYPVDHFFWEFLAYCTGTGGSALIIGSAAGITAMGIEKINFVWYLKKISWLAVIGYFAGALVYLLQEKLFF